MTRVLVVHHDLDMAGQEADSLRRFGYEVVECGGPSRNRCPVLAGQSCDLAERADVLVYDVWSSGDIEGSRTLISNIRDVHPDTPVVLTTPGLELSWEEETGPHRVTSLTGQPTGARLHEAIQRALGQIPEPSA
jgi:DNA-binding NtrC family response regulator